MKDKAEDKKKTTKPAAPKMVIMERRGLKANVPPSEVANYKKGDWIEVK
tara:strand:+ start:2181 stop:2327 length:147 start_codon:yes stop_codon:yes gene_type:complete